MVNKIWAFDFEYRKKHVSLKFKIGVHNFSFVTI